MMVVNGSSRRASVGDALSRAAQRYTGKPVPGNARRKLLIESKATTSSAESGVT